MALADGAVFDDWLAGVGALAARHAAFDMPPLQVAELSGFLALRPLTPPAADHALRRLADDCVVALDPWRAPASASEKLRQTQPHFSARQLQQVDRFGYAHVLDDWRLHLTLSDALPDTAARAALQADATAHFAAALAEPLRCDALCVFTEPAPGEPFVLRCRLPLAETA
jgi:hypothetical protein